MLKASLIIRSLLGALASAAPVVASAGDAKTAGQINCVVELYTSQGCSSCPPADALLPTFMERDGTLALSFNVDIWDSLGWKDTLANPKFTQRQRAYAQSRGDGQVYTPQVIVNGMTHAVGSDKTSIDKEIAITEAQTKKMRVAIGLTADGDGMRIDTPTWSVARTAAIDATLWLVKFTPRVEVTIQRGENTGRSVAYHNVVRELIAVGHWRGEAATMRMSKQQLAGCTPGTCAVLLQQGGNASILGAAWVPGMTGI